MEAEEEVSGLQYSKLWLLKTQEDAFTLQRRGPGCRGGKWMLGYAGKLPLPGDTAKFYSVFSATLKDLALIYKM